MQTCSVCNALSPDSATNCISCNSGLREISATALSLKRLQANPRVVSIRILVANNACPACQQMEGSYAKDAVPTLPVEGCSGEHGCRCYYAPVLDRIFP